MPAIVRDDVISREYLQQNQILHKGKEGFGGSGWKHWEAIRDFALDLGAKNALDYGAGECTLRRKFSKEGITLPLAEYDPAVPKLAVMPKPADLVICTDVLEHVEPEKLTAVLHHLASLSRKGCYLAIATRAANKVLPNGKNAHAIIEDTPWWMERIHMMPGMNVIKMMDVRKGGVPTGAPHEVRVWLRRAL